MTGQRRVGRRRPRARKTPSLRTATGADSPATSSRRASARTTDHPQRHRARGRQAGRRPERNGKKDNIENLFYKVFFPSRANQSSAPASCVLALTMCAVVLALFSLYKQGCAAGCCFGSRAIRAALPACPDRAATQVCHPFDPPTALRGGFADTLRARAPSVCRNFWRGATANRPARARTPAHTPTTCEQRLDQTGVPSRITLAYPLTQGAAVQRTKVRPPRSKTSMLKKASVPLVPLRVDDSPLYAFTSQAERPPAP